MGGAPVRSTVTGSCGLLWPVYQIIHPIAWSLRIQQASKQQQLAPQGPGRAPQPKGSQNGTDNFTPPSGLVTHKFIGNRLFSVGPLPAGNRGSVVFWPIVGLWHLEKFRARAENKKTQSPGAPGTFGEKIRPPKKCFSSNFRNPEPDQTGTGGKSPPTPPKRG